MTDSASMYQTYYDISKLTLFGEKGNLPKTPRLVFSFRDGSPRFVVYTGEEKGMINFPSDYLTFGAVLEVLDDIIKSEPGTKLRVDSIGNKFENRERTDQKEIVGALYIGKTEKGMIYMLLSREGSPNIPFIFACSEWYKFRNGDGSDMEPPSMSAYIARGFLNLARGALAKALLDYTSEAYDKGDYKPYPLGGFGENKDKFSNVKGYSNNKKEGIEEINLDSFSDDIPF